MDLLSIISLLSTGSSLLTGKSLLGNVTEGIEGIFGDGTGQQFANVLNSAQSSLNVTPQGGIPGLNAENASLIPANSGEVITDETLQSLNEILGNTEDTDIDALAQTDATNSGGIYNDTKLDDPFGIKAAQANGSPIAVPNTLIPAGSNDTVNADGEVVEATLLSSQSAAKPVEAKDIAQQSALGNVKVEDKKELFKLGEKVTTDNSAVTALNENSLNKLNSPKSELQPGVQNVAEKLVDKASVNQNSNPAQAAFLAHDPSHRGIGDAARAIRAKEDLKDRMAESETYKVVNVNKRDNILDLRLEPAQLGKVQIKFDFTDGKTNIMVFAERPETLELLQKDTKSIQKILTDNGIQSDANSMSFNLSQQQKQRDENFNFFTGKPLSFRVEEEVSKIANNNINTAGYGNYAGAAYNGLLNIMV